MDLNPPEIRTAQESDRQRALHSLCLGFSSDPLVRWLWPDPSRYLEVAEAFDAYGGRAIDHGYAHITSDCEAVAFWLPPGIGPDEERLVAYLDKTVPEARQQSFFSVLEKMESFHPEEDCWYLPLIAVDPIYQGNGLGSQLMKHSLALFDETGLPTYLESSNPRNIPFYERHGFELMGQIQVDDSPLVHPMIRTPA